MLQSTEEEAAYQGKKRYTGGVTKAEAVPSEEPKLGEKF